MEEFEEADILWSNCYFNHADHDLAAAAELRDPPSENRRKSSNPIDIPSSKLRFLYVAVDRSGDGGNESVGKENGGYWIPPHVVLAPRISDEISSSVRVGTGRTLKGRDLVRARNFVLRMTGFLEA